MIDLLKEISAEGIVVDVKEGELQLYSSKTNIDSNLLSKIRTNKKELISYLTRNDSSAFEKVEYKEIPKYKESANYPLSNAQLRLWLACQMQGEDATYNMPNSIVLNGVYDISYFQKAINAVIERHEILRTVFRQTDVGEIRQFILTTKELGFRVDYKDYRAVDDPEAVAKTYISSDAYQPFNLAEGPLLRVALLRLSDDRYILYFNMHHIISDGGSMEILSKDVMSFYSAYVSGTNPDIPSLRIQYKDYAAWQLDQLESEVYQGHKTYWSERLSGDLPVIDLPSNKLRPPFRTNNGKSLGAYLPKGLTAQLDEFVNAKGGSLFTLILSAINVLIYKYTSGKDIIIESPFGGRVHPDLENQIGFYVNALIFRNEINPEESFVKFYKEATKNALEAFAHQEYPFDKIVEDLGIKYDQSRTSIYDISLTLHDRNTDISSADIDARLFEETTTHNEFIISKNDIEFHVTPLKDTISFSVIFNTDVYEEEMISDMMLHLKQLLSSLLSSPEKPIARVEYLTDQESKELLKTFNAPQIDHLEQKTVVDLFIEQAQTTPDATAVVFKDLSLTFKELDERSNQLAHCLVTTYEVKKGDWVGIHLDRSEAYVVCILGILKAGGAYVPIDVNYPTDRKTYIIEDTGINLILSDTEHMFEMDFYDGTLMAVDVELDSEQDKQVEINLATGEDKAYLIYTSGSTGNPKGVQINHSNLYSSMVARNTYYPEALSSLLIPSFSFDSSVAVIWDCLTRGKELFILGDYELKNFLLVEELLNKHRVESILCVPSYYKVLIEQMGERLPFSRVILAGESLKMDLVKMHYDALPETVVYNEYGPTENTVWSTAALIKKDAELITIGKPVSNTMVYILDEYKNMVPKRVSGEMYLGGYGLSEGYVNQEELTAEKFINHPYRKGERLYKTGDLARWQPDGNIEFLGRKDHQVKIRGYRIELGEIEAALDQIEEVNQSVVVVREDKSGSNQLVSYIVCRERLDHSIVQKSLEAKLPEYMVPKIYVSLDELPLTSNGKIDHKALPEPDDEAYNKQEYVAPENDTEKKLAGIWQEILGIEKIGTKDNFFSLGGSSLSAIRLIGQYNKVFNRNLTIKEIFANPILSDHAGLLDKSSEVTYKEIKKVEEAESYPLSNAQLRLWLASQFEGGTVTFNMPGYFGLDETYDVASFEKAILAVIDRHEMLRTVFRMDDSGEVRQYILTREELNFKIDFQDFRTAEDPSIAYKTYISQDAYQPFDLAAGPLLRVSFLHVLEGHYAVYHNMHHIITDEWSMDVLTRDLMMFYEAYASGSTPDIPPLRVHYKDYTVWQLDQLAGEKYQGHKSYWLEKLSGDLPLIDLPSNKIRPSVKTNKGKSLGAYLSKELTTQINQFIEAKGGSLYMLVLSTINVLIYKYTSGKDIIIGSPFGGRAHPDLGNQIGYYINNLILRHIIDPSEKFIEFYKKVENETLEAFVHQEYPFDKLIEDLNLNNDQSRNSIYDISLTLHDRLDNITSKNIAPHKLENIELKKEFIISKNDIEFHVTPLNDVISLGAVFNPDVYDEEMITGMIQHLKQLFASLVSAPEELLNNVNFLTREEQHELLEIFNAPQIDSLEEKTVLDLFTQQSKVTPDATAIAFNNKRLSYKELEEQSNQLAYCLINEYDLKKGDLVGILLDRSDVYIVSILGILKSGAAYVPIDKNYPSNRKKLMIDDAGIELVVTDTGYMFEMDFYEGTLFAIDVELDAAKGNQDNINLATAQDSAYLIYTSGSAGTPKGVLINHANLYSSITARNSFYQDAFSTLLVPSFSFDASVAAIWDCLTRGAALYILEDHDLKNVLVVAELLNKNQIEAILCVPSYYNVLLEYMEDKLPFKRVILGGESLKINLVKRHYEALPEAALYNEYGPTENTIWSTAALIEKETEVISIGKPISNTMVYILDDNGKVVPKEVTGEIYLGGFGLSKGYLNRQDLTAEKFIDHPFKKGERLYKTGDLARWLREGSIEFLGRKDQQVKVRGYRIELGEIEAVLDQVAGVKQSVVMVKEEKNASGELVAYIVCEDRLDHSAVKKNLAGKLPEYMVPKIFVSLEEMPLTANGKIDIKALPEPDDEAYNKQNYVAPESDTEKKLAEIWQEVLGLEKIGVKDDFFNLGGSSLTAIRLIGQYNKIFNRNITIKEVFGNPLFSEQVALLEVLPEVNYKEISKVEESESYPLSNAQLRLWLASQFEGGGHGIAFNSPSFIEFVSDDISSFQKAIHAVIGRHEVLRTVFKMNESEEVRQYILSVEDLNFKIDIQDYRKADDQKAACKAYIAQDAYLPFDLKKGPLLRAALLRLTDDRYLFYYNMHHIISDGWSMNVLSRDVMAFYDAYRLGETPDLLPLRIQYKDYASWQLDRLDSEEYQEHQSYWLERLSGELPLIDLPSNKRRPPVKTNNGKSLNTYLSKDLTSQSNAFIDKEGGSLFMLTLSIINVLVSKYISGKEIIIGCPSGGRPHPDLENQIGYYVNNLIFRHTLHPSESFAAFYKRVEKDTLEAFEHQEYPFDKLVEDLGVRYDQSRTAVYDLSLTLHDRNEDISAKNIAPHLFEEVEAIDEFVLSKNDIEFHLTPLHDVVSLGVVYNTDVYEEEMVSTMMQHMKQLFSSLLSSPESPIGYINYLSSAEHHELTHDFNNTRQEYPTHTTVLNLFEEQAVKNPQSKAIVFKDQELTYEALNQISNQLANCLVEEYGVKAGDLVGIQLDRSEWFVISILGILKTGAAYVPVDPQYPADRKQHMITDAGIELLLTDTTYMFDMDYYDGTLLTLDAEFDPSKYKSASLNITSPGDLAYVIYTSGSTGLPKGVMVEHSNLMNLVYWQKDFLKRKDPCQVMQYFSFSFDGAVGETFWTLCTGSTLCMYDHHEFNATGFYDYLKAKSINVFVTIPSFLKLLNPADFKDFPDLLIVVVGEIFDVDLYHKWKDTGVLVNGYGPTENTVYSTVYELGKNSDPSRIPIGKPISNTKVHILDDQLQLVPKGVQGEIYVSGKNVARGYLNREELTNERFIADVFEVKYLNHLSHSEASIATFISEGNKETGSRETFTLSINSFYKDEELTAGLREALKSMYETGSEVFRQCFLRYLNESKSGYYSSFGFTKKIISEILGEEEWSGMSVLDLGFGNGELLDMLEETGAEVHGVEANPYFVQKQLSRGHAVRMSRIDIEESLFFSNTGYAENQFDVVFMTLLLDRLEYPKQALEVLFSVLKTEGRFCVQTLLPIIPFDDGEYEEKLTYTASAHTITKGQSEEEDKLQMLTLLQRLGGNEIEVRSLDYYVRSTDGNQKYTLWSFSGKKKEGAGYLYKTGDLGRWLSGGEIEFLGRKDDMVKIRGHRIELGEIESVLNQLEEITQSVVVVREDDQGSKDLVAYVVSEGEAGHLAIQKKLGLKLPDYMVPKLYISLEEMPLTTNGKIDRKALPALNNEAYNKQEYVAPESETEKQLVEMWQEVLGVEKVGTQDDFFALGGHSLSAIKIVLKIKKELNIELNIKNLFDYTKVADLALHIDFSKAQEDIKSKSTTLKQIM